MLKRLLRPLYAPPRTAYQYLQARRIVRDYASNYEASRAVYRSAGGADRRVVQSLDQLGVRVITPGAGGNVIELPPACDEIVAGIARDAAERFALTRHCFFMPRIDRHGLPEATADVPAIRRQEIISLQLADAAGIPGVAQLSETLLPLIESQVFGAWVIVDKVYAYRNLVTRLPEQVSWLWHYDNHPTEVVKIMIYLTDVGEENAPFEFVRHRSTGEPLMFTPRPLLGNSRVAAEKVQRLLDEGYEVVRATGPRGTLVLFDDNVLHRATFPRQGLRDVVVLQIRPCTFRPDRRLDPRWSGSFEHVDFNVRPDEYTVQLKRTRFSG